jgi:hypothetical protein
MHLDEHVEGIDAEYGGGGGGGKHGESVRRGRGTLSSECGGRYITNADAPCAALHDHTHRTHVPVGVLNCASLLKTQGDSIPVGALFAD